MEVRVGSLDELFSMLGNAIGIEPEEQASEAPQQETSKLDQYIEFSTEQLAVVMRQRDEARDKAKHFEEAYQEEVEHHNRCHDRFEAVLNQARINGYAEAIAAGLYPGVPFETLNQDKQEAIMRETQQGVARIDKIRSELEAADQKYTSQVH